MMLFLTLLLAVAGASGAQAQKGDGNVELYLGYYFPESSGDEEPTYGLRAGYRLADAFSLEGTVGRFETDVLASDVEVTFTEVSLVWFVNPEGPNQFFLYGGPGWAFVEANGLAIDDSLTAHVGLGARIALSEALYLRPDARARWFEDGGNDLDFEVSLAFGVRFGN